MTARDNDSDLGTVVVTVVLGTLVAGAIIYGFNRYETIKTALNIPSVDRTVPSIVPSQPQL